MDKKMMALGTSMLVLKLLEAEEMYGYQIIKELEKQSREVFVLKEGTLYPVLHGLEQQGAIVSLEQAGPNGRMRKYYRLTENGQKLLREKEREWQAYSEAVSRILGKEVLNAGV